MQCPLDRASQGARNRTFKEVQDGQERDQDQGVRGGERRRRVCEAKPERGRRARGARQRVAQRTEHQGSAGRSEHEHVARDGELDLLQRHPHDRLRDDSLTNIKPRARPCPLTKRWWARAGKLHSLYRVLFYFTKLSRKAI